MQTGLWLKENISQNKYFTITIANGYFGYVPPEHEIGVGGMIHGVAVQVI